MTKIERGKPLTELVKGSLDYTMHRIRQAFYKQFKTNLPEDEFYSFWLEEIFADYVIVGDDRLPADEYYRVLYQPSDETYVFVDRDAWEVVELNYQPRSIALAESGGRSRKRFVERINSALALTEIEASNPDGPWQIQGWGITADVVNGNGRRYAAHVLEAAVRDLRTHLRESAGQGRLVLTGEADHPADKGHRTPLLQETIINWENVDFDGQRTLIAGKLLGTRLGKDVRAQMKGGVRPDISQRAYGQSIMIEEDGRQIEEVIQLTITGYDLVAGGSDPQAGVMMIESNGGTRRGPAKTQKPKEDSTMDELTLEALREKYPQLVARIEKERDESRRRELEAHLQALSEADKQVEQRLKEKEAGLREKLGIGPDEDLVEALTRRQAELTELKQRDEAQEAELAELRAERQKQVVAAHVADKLAGLKYPAELKEILAEALHTGQPATIEEAEVLIEAKVKEYDAIMARLELVKKGFGSVQVLGPVFERETGTPEFARPAFELTERLVERGLARRRDLREAVTPNDLFTRRYLEAFDRAYQTQLLQESQLLKQWQEAESTTDLNLPYAVSRTIIEEVFPELVALSIFDFGLEDMSPSRVYFEQYAGESGSTTGITDESFTSSHDSWVKLNQRSIQPGTVTVTSDPAGTTYAEWDDYVLDYGEGKIMVLSTGAMADATGFLISYTYDAVRRGENQAIQRGKGTLSYQTIELRADRLASLVTDEAITFARSQLGWDAVTRTLNMVIRELREIIDKRAIYMGLASAVRAANSGGSWSSGSITQTTLGELVQKLGAAKVAVMNDHYMPGFFLFSLTNADILSNWDGFKRDGFPDAVMNSAGFVGQVKGLPVFQSPQMPDSKALTGHRELVQHRVLSNKVMSLKGPFQAYSSGNLVAAQEWYAEEYNATVSLIPEKGGFVTIT